MVALAMGAARVGTIGSDAEALAQLRHALGDRVVPAVVTGADGDADLAIIKRAVDAALDAALDMLGDAASTSTTSATLRSLERRGRLVVMGSAQENLPISFVEMSSNDWEVIGNFMYPKTRSKSCRERSEQRHPCGTSISAPDAADAATPALPSEGETAVTMRKAEGVAVLEQSGGEPGGVRRGRVPFEEALDEAPADPEMRAVLAR